MELVISRPGSTGDRYITARVDDTTSSTIVVADVGGASAPVYAALNGQTQGFVVYDFHTGDNTTGGNWTDAPNHLLFLNVTRFTDENADFQSYMVGWTIIADVEKPSFLTIFAVPTATRVEVFGDATGLSADGQTYRLVAPPGVDPTTGALSKPNTVLSKRADNRGCAWLWSGYQYVPPQVGHESGGSTTGAQGGINKLGTYYCWNRTYDVFMGRWTTPDPIEGAEFNLQDYSHTRPLDASDPAGTLLPLLAAIGGAAIVIGGALLASGCGSKSTCTASTLPMYKGSSRGASGTLQWDIDMISAGWDHMKATFQFHPDPGCACDEIAFIQTVSNTTNGMATPVSPSTYGAPRGHKFPTQIISPSQWWVDIRPTGHMWANHVYAGLSMLDLAPTFVAYSPDRIGACGSTYAQYQDEPKIGESIRQSSSHRSKQYETCAICMSSREILGCVRWGWGWSVAPGPGGSITHHRWTNIPTFSAGSSALHKEALNLATSAGFVGPTMKPTTFPMGGTSAVN